ncbi:CD74 molecule, major histocompatibility complex, class II invariant chain b [Centroberyx affinis]|uniref:CD74 molecule, major histocompatibility complex, class II invariant chain b n=1 Tax=Centroberyx affinis TaxID=166261 RepID=UPI003A5BDF01
MSDPQTQSEPLLRAPSQQTAINVGAQAVGGSSTRAYKVAGFTLLACLLIAGQAVTAYFVLSQRNDIRSLKDQNNNMKDELKSGSSASVPMRMHMPMNIMPKLMDDSIDEEASTEAPEKRLDPDQATQCQLEAAGLKPVKLPTFRPVCDEQGRYRPQQCWGRRCWCVNTASGKEIPGSFQEGPAQCGATAFNAVSTGGLSRVMALPDMMELHDE